VEITKDGKAESVSVKDDIAARVQIYTDEHGNVRVRCQVLFVKEEAEKAQRNEQERRAKLANQKTSQGHASDES
jgi:hypothetical protein